MLEETLSLDTWKRFVNEDSLDTSRLNKRIAESWHRCKEACVNPYQGKAEAILSDELFQAKREKSTCFLETAVRYINRIQSDLEELGMIALLIDSEGYILSSSGNKQVLRQARKINFIEGVCWTEQEVGTNAIGTALKTQESMMVRGAEHYAVSSHAWSCAAVPIRNEDGIIVGILDFTCPIERTHPYMLGMAISAGYAIEQEIRSRIKQAHVELFERSFAMVDLDIPAIICDQKQGIIGVSRPIRKEFSFWSGMDLSEIMQSGYQVQKKSPIVSNITNQQIGHCLYLQKKPQALHSVLISKSFSFRGEAGTSAAFKQTLNAIKKVASTNASVAIFGKTGTGKEVIAQAVHENSERKNGPFIAVNCGAIPKELMESELFGYAEGAFTGARRNGFKGKFEQAHQGTLFLDEIGEITPSMQVALLRVLQERSVTPVGSSQSIPVDVRIISATHQDLQQLVHAGTFRSDLFYRLHVFPIYVPTLHERKEDIPHLVRFYCRKHHWHITFPQAFFTALQAYTWPGNIRELFNVLERLHIMMQDEELHDSQLISLVNSMILSPRQTYSQQNNGIQELSYREIIQKERMIEALKKTNGNVSLAAKLLDVPRSTFYKRLQRFGLSNTNGSRGKR
ncbi:sigma-54-dependent Fis family transcriptional regulator [Bacillus chungangensis]|uniref:Transcriptional regulator of acetoin/glycerol metabolism n=1 Tax=Bacillus chungangensis TaxID=587633 RepID=A0ABT9WWB1_9BACI|nr:sigma-54-dependent Fis family transcriptional regulator [Bacillus chungangensis]MDQ0177591.1 transcriptional regulator of acetoin/glycerol metabolism [Bacillus chungangensis]